MRSIIAALVAVIIYAGTGNAIAQQPEPLQALSNLVVQMKKDQESSCVKPRNHTPAQCSAAFDAAISLVVEATGWQVLLAKAMQDGDKDRVAFYKKEHARVHEFGIKVLNEIDQLYVTRAASAISQPTPVAQQR